MKLDKKANFLNLPAKAKNWVLLANHVDKSLIRNAMAFEMGKFMGFAYTPPIQFVDVVLNGEYVGNYMVTDQIEVNKNRVNVVEQDSASISTGNLTGGYLLEIDGFAGQEPYHFFTTKKNMPVTIKNPKDDENTADQREEMKRYISGYFDEIEDILYSADFKDPEKGWRSRIDEKSLVDWYIVCEYTGNNDAFGVSMFTSTVMIRLFISDQYGTSTKRSAIRGQPVRIRYLAKAQICHVSPGWLVCRKMTASRKPSAEGIRNFMMTAYLITCLTDGLTIRNCLRSRRR